jgi:hypothetical protein
MVAQTGDTYIKRLATDTTINKTVYNSSNTITTSSYLAKNSIEDLDERYLKLLDNLRPVRFKYNNGTS